MQTSHARAALLRAGLILGTTPFAAPLPVCAVIDRDFNQQSDLWQLRYDTGNLAASADEDGDGFSNYAEALAGTDPLSAGSAPRLAIAPGTAGVLDLRWDSLAGKRYELFAASSLAGGGNWASAGVFAGVGGVDSVPFAPAGLGAGFFRLAVGDIDSDGDGLVDWEERQIGFDPQRANTEGFGSATVTDFTRVNTALGLLNTVTVAALDPVMDENWPDAGVVAVRRTGNLDPIVVNFTVTGTAAPGVDYTGPASGSVALGLGVDEVWLSFVPRADALAEAAETIVVTITKGYNYAAGAANTATLALADSPAGAVSEKEAVRFLAQAAFGADSAELARVRQLGIAGWIDDQLARPAQLHLPLVQQWQTEIAAASPGTNATSTERTEVWWRRALQRGAAADPLRQRVAHALGQILVVSDRASALEATPRGVASYQDTLLTHAFGNYRDLLRAVSLHPAMGLYLSHLRNRKADPARNRYPDENYAREIMQLFSIGLWQLAPDGSRVLDGAGQPIPTYDNNHIAALARVFTGLSYSRRFVSATDITEVAATGFLDGNGLAWYPMRGFDAYHDLEPKTLPGDTTLPARTASSPDTGAATLADVDAAVEVLAAHPNVGPFLGRQLIQRLVTSNPSPAYIGRVAAVFANNGAGVRGDLGAVVRTILLDPEARDAARLAGPAQGLQREPYLRYVALVRALGTVPADGRYRGFRSLDGDFLQRPLSAPSVFNFYSPDYRPLGPLQDAGLVAPEFQITNSITGVTSPNRYYNTLSSTSLRLNVSSQTDPALDTTVDVAPWLDDATNNPETLVARLDRLLAAGQLSPATLRQVLRAVRRLPDPLATADPAVRTTRATDRLRMALYLVLISPEFCVLR